MIRKLKKKNSHVAAILGVSWHSHGTHRAPPSPPPATRVTKVSQQEPSLMALTPRGKVVAFFFLLTCRLGRFCLLFALKGKQKGSSTYPASIHKCPSVASMAPIYIIYAYNIAIYLFISHMHREELYHTLGKKKMTKKKSKQKYLSLSTFPYTRTCERNYT